DRAGAPIRGLTQANFEILDEGKKRTVSGFEPIDFSTRDAAAPPITAAARRNFLLLFDLSFSAPSSLSRAQAAAREFATKMVTRDDRIAVASVDVTHGFRLLTSFTTDHALVDAAIANPTGYKTFDPLQLAGATLDREVTDFMNLPTRGGPGRTPIVDPNSAKIAVMNLEQDMYTRNTINRELTLLGGLTATLRAVRGQKHIVLLSEGFDPRLVQGRDAGSSREGQEEQAYLEKGEIWNVDNEKRFGSSGALALVDQLADIAKRADVTLDAVDIKGVRGQTDARTGYEKKSSNEGLHLLTSATGGTLFQNSNSLVDDLRRALKAQEVVYVLAFQAPVTEPGLFHELKVKLVNVPGGRAVARSGYYEVGGGSAAERALANAEILVNDIPQDSVHVSAVATPSATEGEKAQVPVVIEINGDDVITGDEPLISMQIYTYAFDAEGKVRDSLVHRIVLEVAKVGPKLRQNGVKYYETLSLPPGHYVVKTLVHVEQSDKKGFVRRDVVVPAPGAPAAPAVVAEERKDWLIIRDPPRGRN
ncbi:MAG TPA: VWA domain-containing protein, partial [Thermoanaerobaculia bacterium]|nr:VWA domain-containing protein [Thermoanaerobaculia bacterium]